MTIPGVGPISATAITALAPAAGSFRAGRDFAAWLGLTPLQKTTGGKQKLGAISKRGERTIRRLLGQDPACAPRTQACRITALARG
jgi:transposase